MGTTNRTEKIGNAWFFPPAGEWKAIHFYNLPETTRPLELDEGRLIMSAPPGMRHQHSVKMLHGLLNKHVRVHNLGRVFSTTMPLQISDTSVRRPDVMFVERGNAALKDDFCVKGSPDWIAEVIEADTRQIDQDDKLDEYAQLGIPEYWLIDPEKREIQRFQLAYGRYRLEGLFNAGQVIESFVIEAFRLNAAELF